MNYAPKRELVNIMRKILSETGPESRGKLKRLLDGMDEFDQKPKKGLNDLALDDWGDAFIIALNEVFNPGLRLVSRVEDILNYANECDSENISMDDIDKVMDILRKGIGTA